MDLPIVVGISPSLGIRGILSSRLIKKGALIEACPVILAPIAEKVLLDQTVLSKFHFDWNREYLCICLGYGALFNHSYTPNAEYRLDYKNKQLTFWALREIPAGEEIFVNYNWDPDDASPMDLKYTDYNENIVT